MKAFLFDTETTGLISNHTIKLDMQPEIIEFYGCLADIEEGEIIQEIDLLIKPKKIIEDDITKITGLTQEMIENSPSFAEVSEVIKWNIENAPLVIAHNLSFDMEMVDLEFERFGQKIKWPDKICTVEQTVHLKGYRVSLSVLHETLFGMPFTGAHRAKVDVSALLFICKELYRIGEL
jgi:DNA polymerase III epsilon subunit family exonuclease